MWTITLRLEILNSNNQPTKEIKCEKWTGAKTDPFYVAHTATEVLHLNRNNILSIVKKKQNECNSETDTQVH